MAIDEGHLANLAALFQVVEMARDYPKLKPLHDAALADLEAYADNLVEKIEPEPEPEFDTNYEVTRRSADG